MTLVCVRPRKKAAVRMAGSVAGQLVTVADMTPVMTPAEAVGYWASEAAAAIAYRDEAIVAMRAEGASLRDIETAGALSRAAVRRVLARAEAAVLAVGPQGPASFPESLAARRRQDRPLM